MTHLQTIEPKEPSGSQGRAKCSCSGCLMKAVIVMRAAEGHPNADRSFRAKKEGRDHFLGRSILHLGYSQCGWVNTDRQMPNMGKMCVIVIKSMACRAIH